MTKLIVLAYISLLQRFSAYNDEVKASSEHNVNIANKTYVVKFNDIGTLEEGKSYKFVDQLIWRHLMPKEGASITDT